MLKLELERKFHAFAVVDGGCEFMLDDVAACADLEQSWSVGGVSKSDAGHTKSETTASLTTRVDMDGEEERRIRSALKRWNKNDVGGRQLHRRRCLHHLCGSTRLS